MGCGPSSGSVLEPRGRKLMLMGCTGSGKTTLLYQVTKNMSVAAIPTIGNNAEYLTLNKEKFILCDIGGGNPPDSQSFLDCAVGLVFFIDATDQSTQTLKESINLFTFAVNNVNLRSAPVAICLNKQDKSDAICIEEEDVMKNFPLSLTKQYKIFKTSSKAQTNIEEPFKWMQSLNLKTKERCSNLDKLQKQQRQQSNKSTNNNVHSSNFLPGSTEHPQSQRSH